MKYTTKLSQVISSPHASSSQDKRPQITPCGPMLFEWGGVGVNQKNYLEHIWAVQFLEN